MKWQTGNKTNGSTTPTIPALAAYACTLVYYAHIPSRQASSGIACAEFPHHNNCFSSFFVASSLLALQLKKKKSVLKFTMVQCNYYCSQKNLKVKIKIYVNMSTFAHIEKLNKIVVSVRETEMWKHNKSQRKKRNFEKQNNKQKRWKQQQKETKERSKKSTHSWK